MREIITRWTGPGDNPKLSIMYFLVNSPLNEQREAIHTMWQSVASQLVPGISWTIDTEARLVDEATGATTGFESDSEVFTGSGSNSSGNPVPDAAQVLLQWHTNSVANGRRVRGRTFVPGLAAAQTDGGNLSASTRNTFATAAETFQSTMPDFAIWHRPIDGAGGSQHQVQAATAWNELAVQRGRRG